MPYYTLRIAVVKPADRLSDRLGVDAPLYQQTRVLINSFPARKRRCTLSPFTSWEPHAHGATSQLTPEQY